MTRPLTSSQARAALVDYAAGLRLRAEQLWERAGEPTAAEELDAAADGHCALLRRWDTTAEEGV